MGWKWKLVWISDSDYDSDESGKSSPGKGKSSLGKGKSNGHGKGAQQDWSGYPGKGDRSKGTLRRCEQVDRDNDRDHRATAGLAGSSSSRQRSRSPFQNHGYGGLPVVVPWISFKVNIKNCWKYFEPILINVWPCPPLYIHHNDALKDFSFFDPTNPTPVRLKHQRPAIMVDATIIVPNLSLRWEVKRFSQFICSQTLTFTSSSLPFPLRMVQKLLRMISLWSARP